MGILDLFKKSKKTDTLNVENNVLAQPIDRQVVPSQQMTHDQLEQNGYRKLDLSKKMDNSFKKLNLDKPDVLSSRLFVLDTSGSMDDEVDDKRKIDHLRNTMKNYTSARKICFSDKIYTDNKIPEPSGSTDLARALRYISKMPDMPKRIVLVSDGEPNSECEALDAATSLELPIDIIFIGDERRNGKNKGWLFMEKLAEITGGENFIV